MQRCESNDADGSSTRSEVDNSSTLGFILVIHVRGCGLTTPTVPGIGSLAGTAFDPVLTSLVATWQRIQTQKGRPKPLVALELQCHAPECS